MAEHKWFSTTVNYIIPMISYNYYNDPYNIYGIKRKM